MLKCRVSGVTQVSVVTHAPSQAQRCQADTPRPAEKVSGSARMRTRGGHKQHHTSTQILSNRLPHELLVLLGKLSWGAAHERSRRGAACCCDCCGCGRLATCMRTRCFVQAVCHEAFTGLLDCRPICAGRTRVCVLAADIRSAHRPRTKQCDQALRPAVKTKARTALHGQEILREQRNTAAPQLLRDARGPVLRCWWRCGRRRREERWRRCAQQLRGTRQGCDRRRERTLHYPIRH